MKARLEGTIKSMVRDREWVTIAVDTTGAVTEGGKSPESKATGAEIQFRLKPVVADELKFGQKLYFTVSDEAPKESR